jgi:alanine racemase
VTTAHLRPAWAEVDLARIRANVAALVRVVAPSALCAVVKADGYGHGAVPVARAALDGGAQWLAVALVEEGVELRRAGIEAPVLVLSQPPTAAWGDVVEHRLVPTVDTLAGASALAERLRVMTEVALPPGSEPRDVGWPVHVKVDTGMHRVGASPDEVAALVAAVSESPELGFHGLWTHLAVSESDDSFNDVQLERLEQVRRQLEAGGLVPGLVHAANSGGALLHPAGRLDLVRCGIAVYGYPPAPGLAPDVGLAPALSLVAHVSHVSRQPAGERVSYGRRYSLPADGYVATVPLGYADGVPRALSLSGGEVLIAGRRFPMAGAVTMDQLMVDCGEHPVAPGDEVVLIGRQGDEEITAEDWAGLVGTISYEILCGVGPRVRRRYVNDGG